MVSVASINLIYQFWVHTRHIPKLGWYEYFFVTPSNHRVHHAQNDLYIDRNYGGVFIIWDRIFKTFQEENEDEECIYGIRGSIRTFDPIKANLHIYSKIIKDISYSLTFSNIIMVLTAKTGWSPDGDLQASSSKKFNKIEFKKHNPETSTFIKVYALVQFFCMSYAAVVLFPSTIEYYQGLILLLVVSFSMYCTANWLDAKKIIGLEYLRLVLIFVSAAYLYSISPQMLLFYVLSIYLIINTLLLPFLRRAI